MNDDIAYIEAQSQGLQVQAANQKLLKSELTSLLETISISPEQLESLREASLEKSNGLAQIESSLVLLFKAMLTIDPSLSLSSPRKSFDGGSIRSGKSDAFGNSELSNMRVLQEKKDVYRNESMYFLRRLRPYLQVKFGAAAEETRKLLEREKASGPARPTSTTKIDPRHHDVARQTLWRYSPLMLFARDVNRSEWMEIIKHYETACKPLYQNEFRDAILTWKRSVRKSSGDESDILFTSQLEKQSEGLASTARKLTVKKSVTLAKTLRSDHGSKSAEKSSDGRQPYEAFGGILDDILPIVTMEQNFIVEFFRINSTEQKDFADAVAAASPDDRVGGDLRRPKAVDPNKDLTKLLFQSMEEIYAFLGADMQALVEWTLQGDPL